MTNKEYLQAQLGFAASANLLDGALLDVEITGSDSYSATDKVLLKTAAISILHVLLSTADTESGSDETRQSIKYDRNAILKRIARLESEVGLTDNMPKIKALHIW